MLALLPTGGNLAFRQLCAELGAPACWGEMMFARSLLRGHPIERARLKRAPGEKLYCAQIATNALYEGAGVLEALEYSSTSFVSLNCGCPKSKITGKGLGTVLLRRPEKLDKPLEGLVSNSNRAIEMKVRLSPTGEEARNIHELADAVEAAGASALTIHGRTKEARYTKSADWNAIEDVARKLLIPVIGNGDVLILAECELRSRGGSTAAVMAGRGALIKPWLFWEVSNGAEWHPTAPERIKAVYFRLAQLMRDHFGPDDIRGSHYDTFMPWHLSFLQRARPLPSSEYSTSLQDPLIQRRFGNIMPHESEEEVSLLKHLLRKEGQETFDAMANELWHSDSSEDATARLQRLAEELLGGEKGS